MATILSHTIQSEVSGAVSLRFTAAEGFDGGEIWLMEVNGRGPFAVIDVLTSDPATYVFAGTELNGNDMGAIYAFLNLADAML